MPDIPLDHVLRLEHEPKAPPPAYTPPEYSAEAAPPAYTSTTVANDFSVPQDDQPIHSFRGGQAGTELPPRDKRPAWRRAITRRYCGLPGWALLSLMVVGVVAGAAVGSLAKKAKADLFLSDHWYSFQTTETYGWQYHLRADTDPTSNKVRLLADDQIRYDRTAGQWQVRKLMNYTLYEESCKKDVGKDDITLYWIKNCFTGPSKRLGFKEKLFTQQQVRDSGNETLELELSDDPANEQSQTWYAEGEDDGYNGGGTAVRLRNCVTKEDFVLGWQNTTSETGSKIVAPVMVFAADKSKHVLWNVVEFSESYKIKPGDGW